MACRACGEVALEPTCPHEEALAKQLRVWQLLALFTLVSGSVVGYYIGRGH